ncbi:hypothetical protein Bbelb_384310 [Branchiostoma belcheri]|nr:hypothetical protein Bbelb_384310 [Branchiostoma belcheri]
MTYRCVTGKVRSRTTRDPARLDTSLDQTIRVNNPPVTHREQRRKRGKVGGPPALSSSLPAEPLRLRNLADRVNLDTTDGRLVPAYQTRTAGACPVSGSLERTPGTAKGNDRSVPGDDVWVTIEEQVTATRPPSDQVQGDGSVFLTARCVILISHRKVHCSCFLWTWLLKPTTGKLRQAQWRARKLCVVGATYTHRQQVPATWHKVAGTSYTAQTQLRLPPIVTAAAHMALAYIQHQLPAPKVCKSASRKLRNELEYSHHELPGAGGNSPRLPGCLTPTPDGGRQFFSRCPARAVPSARLPADGFRPLARGGG